MEQPVDPTTRHDLFECSDNKTLGLTLIHSIYVHVRKLIIGDAGE